MEQYCILGRIGEGAHGIVFKAKHVETGEIVALKKVALRRLEDGIPNQVLREIKALQEIEDSQYEITELPDYNKISFKEQAPVPLEEVLPDASPQALDLLGRFLLYPPQQRISASQALLHHYFFTAPLPVHPSELPIPQRPGGPAPKAHPGPPHVHDFHVDRPLEESLLNPELIRPFIPEG
uniref:Cyclin-dependent kinase 20 n=1 Tax=Capra hircus TaxID=9925 RepID=A0A8C2Y1A0_CAPHI